MTELRIATRKSALALWQAHHVKQLLENSHAGIRIELVPIVTRGDRILDRPLAEIGGKGLFLKELEQAMLDDAADLAVHSMKDVPPEMAPGLAMDVTLERANPADALLNGRGLSLEALPGGSRVGTSSLRRQCQLLAQRPDLEVVPLRGNVDTRIRKLDSGEYDAIILAAAGLDRLGLSDRIDAYLEAPQWLPAATQGIIALQHREGDQHTAELIAPLLDTGSAVQATAERAVTRLLQGSCQLPLAAYATVANGQLDVQAMVGTADGQTVLRANASGSPEEAESVGMQAAEALLAQGASDIIRDLLN